MSRLIFVVLVVNWNITLMILQVFYKNNVGKRPRIFGMTASPVVGKGAALLHFAGRSLYFFSY